MSDRLPGTSTSNPIIYRGYELCLGPGYTRDSQWQFAHEDYDGPEDNRIGLCATEQECREAIDEQIADILFDGLRAAVGYLRNAQIDLETGCPKATAIRTIKGGIARAEAALSAAIADTHPKDGDVKQAPLVSGGGAPSGAIAQPSTGDFA